MILNKSSQYYLEDILISRFLSMTVIITVLDS